MRRVYKRNSSGGAIVEGAAALTIMLPILMTIIFVAMEASYAYLLKSSLSEAAREAARDLSIAYGLDTTGTFAGNRSMEDAQVFDKIRITNIVNSSAQFDDPVWSPSASPPTVSVTVHYYSNQYGLPPFPNPDPLKIGSSLQIVGSSTYRLQGL